MPFDWAKVPRKCQVNYDAETQFVLPDGSISDGSPHRITADQTQVLNFYFDYTDLNRYWNGNPEILSIQNISMSSNSAPVGLTRRFWSSENTTNGRRHRFAITVPAMAIGDPDHFATVHVDTKDPDGVDKRYSLTLHLQAPIDPAVPEISVSFDTSTMNASDTESIVTFTPSEPVYSLSTTREYISVTGGTLYPHTRTRLDTSPQFFTEMTGRFVPTPGFEGTATVTVLDATAPDHYPDQDNQLGTGGSASVLVDPTSPGVVLSSQSEHPGSGVLTVTVAADETLTGLAANDFAVSGATVESLSGDTNRYVLTVAPDGTDDIVIQLPQNSATDLAGNGNTASNTVTIDYVVNDAPIVSIAGVTTVAAGETVTLSAASSSDPDNDPLTFRWSLPASVSVLDDSSNTLSFDAPSLSVGDNDLVLIVAVEVSDGLNRVTQTVAVTVTAPPDITGPTFTISGPTEYSGTAPFDMSVVANEDVIGLTADDFTHGGVTALSLTGSGDTFTLSVTPDGLNTVTLSLPAGIATDVAVNDNLASATVSILKVDNLPPVIAVSGSTTVSSGSTVTLDASGSVDPESAGLTYLWALPHGVSAASLTDATLSFTAPMLAVGDADVVLDVSLTVSDGARTSSQPIKITVTAAPDNETPVITPPEDITIVAGVNGKASVSFVATVSDNQASAITPIYQVDGTVITSPHEFSLGAHNVTVDAVDQAGNHAKQVSFQVNVTQSNMAAASVDETTQVIRQFMSERSNLLLANLPGMLPTLGGASSGNFNFVATRGLADFDLNTSMNLPTWFRLKATRATYDTSESDYAMGAAGMHFPIGEQTKLGVVLTFDHLDQVDGASRARGDGWLVGPYLVGQIPDQPLFYEAVVMGGKSTNRVSPNGTYEDEFDSERRLARLRVSGRVHWEDVVLTPSLAGTWTQEDQSSYLDSFGTTIPSQTVSASQVSAGLDFALPLDEAHMWMLGGGVSANYTDTEDSSAGGQTSGVVRLNTTYNFGAGSMVHLGSSYGGIGNAASEVVSVDMTLEVKF